MFQPSQSLKVDWIGSELILISGGGTIETSRVKAGLK